MNIDPSKTAVLALHLQRDVVEAGGAFGPFFAEQAAERNVIANSAKVLEAARGAGIPIAYARVSFPEGHPGVEANMPLTAIVLQTNALVQGTPMVEVVPELTPQDGDVVFDHEGTSAFIGGTLQSALDERGVDTVVIVGVASNVIVEGTARDATWRNLTTYVLEDCCSAGDAAAHEASMATLGLITHGVSSSDEFVTAVS